MSIAIARGNNDNHIGSAQASMCLNRLPGLLSLKIIINRTEILDREHSRRIENLQEEFIATLETGGMKPLSNLNGILNRKGPHSVIKLVKQDGLGTEISKGDKRLDEKKLYEKDRAGINELQIETNRNLHLLICKCFFSSIFFFLVGGQSNK